jgi:hypothetical protein
VRPTKYHRLKDIYLI